MKNKLIRFVFSLLIISCDKDDVISNDSDLGNTSISLINVNQHESEKTYRLEVEDGLCKHAIWFYSSIDSIKLDFDYQNKKIKSIKINDNSYLSEIKLIYNESEDVIAILQKEWNKNDFDTVLSLISKNKLVYNYGKLRNDGVLEGFEFEVNSNISQLSFQKYWVNDTIVEKDKINYLNYAQVKTNFSVNFCNLLGYEAITSDYDVFVTLLLSKYLNQNQGTFFAWDSNYDSPKSEELDISFNDDGWPIRVDLLPDNKRIWTATYQ
ncbi:MAG: hypothetical protein ACON5K_04060 [Bacteroidia bacterium]